MHHSYFRSLGESPAATAAMPILVLRPVIAPRIPCDGNRDNAGMTMPPACRWLAKPSEAFLYWNYMCIATVKPEGDGYRAALTWCDQLQAAQVATVADGIHKIEHWVMQETGLPKIARRRRGR